MVNQAAARDEQKGKMYIYTMYIQDIIGVACYYDAKERQANILLSRSVVRAL